MDKNKAKEMWPIIKAFSEGENVEYFNGYSWSKIEYGATFESDFNNYRIKPQPKLVPFKFEDNKEFRDKWIYDTNQKFPGIMRIISCNNSNIHTEFKAIGYQSLFEDYLFEDGLPCGKYINE